MLPSESAIQFTPDLRICRLLNGLWQVSGGHGRIDPANAIPEMLRYHDAGFTTWDLADHYGPAEDFIGEFRRRLAARSGAQAQMQAFTKWVPSPGPMTRQVVERAVDVSRRRMDTDTLDLVQFHWWEYRDGRYLDALEQLAALRSAGKLRHVGLTNFDTERLRIMMERGLPIVSNQVQYSLVDRRPEVAMAPFCQEHGVVLFTYGTLLGGLLSERYLGRPEPGRAELHRQPAQVQADDRRLGRLGAVPGTAAGRQAGGRSSRRQHRQRGRARHPRPAGRGRRHRRRAAGPGRAPGRQRARLQLPAGRRRLGAAGRGAGQVTRPVQGDWGLWGRVSSVGTDANDGVLTWGLIRMQAVFMATDNESTRWEPLPEIIIPYDLIVERERGFNRLVYDPPTSTASTCWAGLARWPLPAWLRTLPLLRRWVCPLWWLSMGSATRSSGSGPMLCVLWTVGGSSPDGDDFGEFSEEEDTQAFADWIAEDSSPAVRATIGRLRAIPAPCRRIAILDDVYISGNVTLGVAPVLYKAAYRRRPCVQYGRQSPSSERQLAAPDRRSVLSLQRRPSQRAASQFLTELAKGKVDRVDFRPLDPTDIRSLDQLADFYAKPSYVWDAESDNPSESVYGLVERYGLNLFSLHERLKAVLREHARKCFRNHV
jgi:aryl-alcohol dehydrogenase-like predicted oxidoreductase